MFLYKKKGAIKAIIWIPKANIKCAMNKVDWMLNTIDVRNLTELSNTIYTAAACFSELVRAHKFPKTNKELWWKRRNLFEIWISCTFYLRKEVLRRIKIDWTENTTFEKRNSRREEKKHPIKAVDAKTKGFNC